MLNGRLSKSWSQRLRINGEPFNIGLGSFPIVSLAEARNKALENRRKVEVGIDPRDKPKSVPSFKEAAEIVIAKNAEGWRKGRHEGNWRASLAQYAYPVIGKRPVDQITIRDIKTILEPIWIEKRETARKLKQRIATVLNWAMGEEYRTDNPAFGKAIIEALPKHTQPRQHQRALPHAEVGAALATICDTKAWMGTKLAFRFLVLTATRSGEVRGAGWSEIDLDAATWTIPQERMKNGREHRVPLPPQALMILEEARELGDGKGLIFPSITGRQMSDNTLSKLLRENGVYGVPHGFRSSFRVWAAETGAPREIAEHALAHIEGSATELAYRRTDYFMARRELMQQWGDYVSPLT